MDSVEAKIRDVIKKLESGSKSSSLNALMFVRKKIVTSPGAMETFVDNGGLNMIFKSVFSRLPSPEVGEHDEMLLASPGAKSQQTGRDEIYNKSLCKTDFKKSLDIALSIVGNLCMTQYIREKVHSLKGLEVIGDILKHVSVPSIQNRACRAIANMCLSADICEQLHEDEDIIPRVVHLLKSTSDVDFQQTLLRCVRILGDTVKHQQLVLKTEAITAAGKLLVSEHSKVLEGCWKTLAHYNTKKLSLEFSKQLAASGCLSVIVDKAKSRDQVRSRDSLSIIYTLVVHSDVRPSLGNAGIITLFMRMIQDNRDPQSQNLVNAVHALCLMCRESVNRVRIREEGGLKLLMRLLNDEDFTVVHERIVGSFVCFLYDSPSIHFLLKEGLVGTLLTQLRKVIDSDETSLLKDDQPVVEGKELNENDMSEDYSESEKFSELNSDCVDESKRLKSPHLLCVSVSDTPETTAVDSIVLKDLKSTADVNELPVGRSSPQVIVCVSRCTGGNLDCEEGQTDTNVNVVSHNNGGKEQRVDTMSVDQNVDYKSGPEVITEEGSGRKSTRYSIHSPTYVATLSDWSFEEYSSGVKCKQTFCPQSHSAMYAGVSPESCISYYSPVHSPEAVSPCQFLTSSPSRSPASSSSMGFSPGNKMYCWGKGEGPSPDVEYSSAEEDNDTHGNFGTSSHQPWDEPTVSEAMIGACLEELEVDKSKLNRGDKDQSSGNLFVDSAALKDEARSSKNIEDLESCQLSTSKTTDQGDEDDDFCNEIEVEERVTPIRRKRDQVMTSTGSHDNSCVKYHTVSDTDSMESNVLTLLSLISHMDDPSPFLPRSVTHQLLDTLLDYGVRCCCQSDSARWYRVLSRICTNPHCLESLLTSVAPCTIYQKLFVCNSNDHAFCTKESTTRSGSKEYGTAKSSKINWHDYQLKGEALLFKLTMQALTSYGHGVVVSKLLKGAPMERLAMSISLCFVCARDPEPRKKLMSNYKVLNILLENLQQNGNYFRETVQALHYLSLRVRAPTGFKVKRLNERRPAIQFNYSTVSLLRSMKRNDGSPVKRVRVDDEPCVSKRRRVSVENSEDTELAEVTSGERYCHHEGKIAGHDVTFVLDSGCRVSAKRNSLVRRSSLFSAMLEGHYSESQQSCIKITNVSSTAFKFILHWLHGCALNKCRHSDYQGIFLSKPDFDVCLEILLLTDRFLLSDLQQEVSERIAELLLDEETVTQLLECAVRCNCDNLVEKCLSFIICSEMPVTTREKCFLDIVNSKETTCLFECVQRMLMKMLGML